MLNQADVPPLPVMLKIRNATPPDADRISALITSLAHLFLASPDGAGADNFREAITPQALALYMMRPDIGYLIAEENGVFCGAVALREHRHLQHLFVAPIFQGRGIGWWLWASARDAAMAAGNPGEFTVNASLNAVPVYQRFGFESVGGPQQSNGLVFQPMRLVLVKDEPPTAAG
jgi:GNAT superfamily N-acetyltransferase